MLNFYFNYGREEAVSQDKIEDLTVRVGRTRDRFLQRQWTSMLNIMAGRSSPSTDVLVSRVIELGRYSFLSKQFLGRVNEVLNQVHLHVEGWRRDVASLDCFSRSVIIPLTPSSPIFSRHGSPTIRQEQVRFAHEKHERIRKSIEDLPALTREIQEIFFQGPSAPSLVWVDDWVACKVLLDETEKAFETQMAPADRLALYLKIEAFLRASPKRRNLPPQNSLLRRDREDVIQRLVCRAEELLKQIQREEKKEELASRESSVTSITVDEQEDSEAAAVETQASNPKDDALIFFPVEFTD